MVNILQKVESELIISISRDLFPIIKCIKNRRINLK